MTKELDQLEDVLGPATLVQLPTPPIPAIAAAAVPPSAATVLAPHAAAASRRMEDDVHLPPPPLPPHLSPRAGTILASQIPSPPPNAAVHAGLFRLS